MALAESESDSGKSALTRQLVWLSFHDGEYGEELHTPDEQTEPRGDGFSVVAQAESLRYRSLQVETIAVTSFRYYYE